MTSFILNTEWSSDKKYSKYTLYVEIKAGIKEAATDQLQLHTKQSASEAGWGFYNISCLQSLEDQ